jgi:hypothetical protein
MSVEEEFPTAYTNETIHHRPQRNKYWNNYIVPYGQWEIKAFPAIRQALSRHRERLQEINHQERIEQETTGFCWFDKYSLNPYFYGEATYPSKFWYYSSINQIDKTWYVPKVTREQIIKYHLFDHEDVLQKEDYIPTVTKLQPHVWQRDNGKVFFNHVVTYKPKGSIRVPKNKHPETVTFDKPEYIQGIGFVPRITKRTKRDPNHRAPIRKKKTKYQERLEYWKERGEFCEFHQGDPFVDNEIINAIFQELLQEDNFDLGHWFWTTTSCIRTKEQEAYERKVTTQLPQYHDEKHIPSTGQTAVEYADSQEVLRNDAHRIIDRSVRHRLFRKLGRSKTVSQQP